jgi:small subunit ribosomal protein S8e
VCLQVRTQTLVKNAIIQIDAAPFKQWYQQHYGVELGQKKGAETAEAEAKVRWGSPAHGTGVVAGICNDMLGWTEN